MHENIDTVGLSACSSAGGDWGVGCPLVPVGWWDVLEGRLRWQWPLAPPAIWMEAWPAPSSLCFSRAFGGSCTHPRIPQRCWVFPGDPGSLPWSEGARVLSACLPQGPRVALVSLREVFMGERLESWSLCEPGLGSSRGTHLDLSLLLGWCGRRRNPAFLQIIAGKKVVKAGLSSDSGSDKEGAALFLGQALLLTQAVGAGLGYRGSRRRAARPGIK